MISVQRHKPQDTNRTRPRARRLRADDAPIVEPQRICFVRKIVSCSALLLTMVLPACSLAGRADSPSGEAGRRRAIQYGLAALDNGEYAAAAQRLAPVAAICPVDELGSRALLLLAAAELDGRNPDGEPDAAAELAAFQLSRSGPDDWTGALAAELYTIALDLGADPIAVEDIPDEGVIWRRYLEGATPLGDDAESRPAANPDAAADVEAGADAEADAQAAAAAQDAASGPRCNVRRARSDLVMPELGRTPISAQVASARGAGRDPAPLTDDVRALQAEVQRLRTELASKEQELDRIRRTLRP